MYVKADAWVLQQIAATGLPLVGGSVSAYITGTTTPLAMYTSSAGAGSATSFTLNSLGMPQSAGGTAVDIYLDDASVYKFIIRDSAGVAVGPTIDPVYPGGGTGTSAEFTSLEALRASSTSTDYATILAANEGGSTGRMELYNNGTTGTPTTNGNRFSALAAGTFFNAAGIGYDLAEDQALSPWIFGAGAALTVATDAIQHAVNYAGNVRGGDVVYIPRKWYVDDEIQMLEGVTLNGPQGKAKCQLIASAGASAMPAKVSRNVTSCPIVAIEGVDNTALIGIGLIGSVGLATGSEAESGGLFIDGADDIVVQKCLIKNCREYHAAVGSDNQVTNLVFTHNYIKADLDTLKASHYSNLLVLTYLKTADIRANVLTSDSGLTSPTDIQGYINTENWGAGTCENDSVSIVGNTIICGLDNSIGISKTGGNVIDHLIKGNKLKNCSIRYTGNVRSLKVQGNTISEIDTRDFAISMEGCAGAGGFPAVIDIIGNSFETDYSGIQILNNSTSTDKSIINVQNNIGYFGSDTSAPRYGLNWVSADNLQAVVSGNNFRSTSAATDNYGYRFSSTDNFTFRNNYAKAYNGASLESTCDTVEIGPNTFDCTVRYANKSMQRGTFEDIFKYTFVGTAAETFYVTTTRENGVIQVTTADNANNANKIYAGLVTFSRAGTTTPAIAESGEVNAANMAFSASGVNLQVTRASANVADTLWVYVRSMFS
jgi:hypothetical protein